MSSPAPFPIALSQEEDELLAKAADYDQLVKMRGWRSFLAYIDTCVEHAQKTLIESQSSDPQVTHELVRAWKLWGKMRGHIEAEVTQTIEDAKQFQAQLREQEKHNQEISNDILQAFRA